MFPTNLHLHVSRIKRNKTGNVRINVTLRHVRVTLLPWKSNNYYIFWVSVCSLRYTAYRRPCAVLYCHLWPVQLYHIFPHYLVNYTNFGKTLPNIKRVFRFSVQLLSETFDFLYNVCLKHLIFCTTFVWNISHSKKNMARWYCNCTWVFMGSFLFGGLEQE